MVLGVKHKEYGQLPICVIELKKNDKKTKSKIEDKIFKTFTSVEKPRKIFFFENIKKNKVGKIDRKFYYNKFFLKKN